MTDPVTPDIVRDLLALLGDGDWEPVGHGRWRSGAVLVQKEPDDEYPGVMVYTVEVG